MDNPANWRKSSQFPMPATKAFAAGTGYDIYPAHQLADNQLFTGFCELASLLAACRNVIIDGYCGVFFEDFRDKLDAELLKSGIHAAWLPVDKALKTPGEIETLVKPFLGSNDPVFGKRTSVELIDFFNHGTLTGISPTENKRLNIIYGCGAALAGWEGTLVYLDLPKNEIQFRSRAGSITNLGAGSASDPKIMYKRFYFVDWVVLNKHKQQLLPAIDIYVDTQHPAVPVWIQGILFKDALHSMANNVFRVKPWFEPGAWGGNWIKEHIPGLNPDVPNYAWSFELIVPENGLLLESSGMLFEFSFDCLMYSRAEAVLGDCFTRFGVEFPIRFDFLDTFGGGNLSIQCHPRAEYIKSYFGENFTQEETYYILDTKEDAEVYLGFREGIDPAGFREALEESFRNTKPVDIEKFVLKHPSTKHDLFLVPAGTIHGSGINNLVLEISSTPYIFTFKMYDWLRPDLDGKRRPLNISRGMENLYFDRQGDYVKEKLLSKPVLLHEGSDWRQYHLPTHETHLYDVNRYHFTSEIEIQTHNKCHVLSLVEGSSIVVETRNGMKQRYSYAETFVIPAACGNYKVTNQSASEAMLVLAFVK